MADLLLTSIHLAMHSLAHARQHIYHEPPHSSATLAKIPHLNHSPPGPHPPPDHAPTMSPTLFPQPTHPQTVLLHSIRQHTHIQLLACMTTLLYYDPSIYTLHPPAATVQSKRTKCRANTMQARPCAGLFSRQLHFRNKDVNVSASRYSNAGCGGKVHLS